MAELKWIKLNLDMFDNRKIKQIRKLPGGNDMVLFWVMLLTLAGKSNSQGYILFTENIPYTQEMLATECDIELNTVKMALEIFSKFNMITTKEEIITITGWAEHQNVEGMEKVREQNRLRKQKQRTKAKELQAPAQEEFCGTKDTSHVTSQDSHNMSRDSHAIDKEEDKEEEIEIEDNYLLYIDEIVDYYCSKAGMLTLNFKATEFDTIKELLSKVPIDVIKKGIDEAFKKYKPKFKGEKINSFNYCKPVILNLWANIDAKRKGAVKDGGIKQSAEDELREQGIGL